MPVSVGDKIGHYEVLSLLGQGGMGEVWKARDTTLKRDVALKVLPPAFLSDPERLARFQREAEVLASLDHPNIGHIHGIVESDGTRGLALALIEGPTLADRIAAGRLSQEEALAIARQIIEALEYAHDRGVVHRDLKPSNIKINSDGVVKVLDFGLAKLMEQGQGDEFATTATAESLTEKGTIIGTVAYMSPEQAEGKKVDPRSDIFSFGSVLYEMVTGRHAFQGNSKISTLAAILHKEPSPASEVSGETPQELERIISRCLKKDPARRFQHMADVKVALDELREESDSGKLLRQAETVASKRRFSKDLIVPALVVGVIILAAVVSYFVWNQVRLAPTPHSSGLLAYRQITFVGNASDPAMSPDGTAVAYVAGSDYESKLMLQDLKGTNAIELAHGALVKPRWSPDGSELLFRQFDDLKAFKLFLISRLGGPARLIAENVYDFCWSPDGTQIATRASSNAFRGIRLIDRQTGSFREISLRGIELIGAIDWSRASNQLLFTAINQDKKNYNVDIWTVLPNGSRQQRVLAGGDTAIPTARWSATGDSIYFLEFTNPLPDLKKISINPETGEAKNQPTVLLTGLHAERGDGFGLSSDGSGVAYVKTDHISNLWLADLTDSGKSKKLQTKQLTKGTADFHLARISPDGKWIAFTGATNGHENVYRMSIEGSTPTQLTFTDSPGVQYGPPKWSPDGKRIALLWQEGQVFHISIIDPDGGLPRQIEAGLTAAPFLTWLPDGHIFYGTDGTNCTILDPGTGEKKPLPLGASAEDIRYPLFSHDGKRIAFQATLQSKRGIWVMSLADNSTKLLLVGEVFQPQWSLDGNWIYAFSTLERTDGRCYLIKMPAGGGDPKTVTLLPEGHPTEFGLSRDGQKLVYNVREKLSDIWLVENFDAARKK